MVCPPCDAIRFSRRKDKPTQAEHVKMKSVAATAICVVKNKQICANSKINPNAASLQATSSLSPLTIVALAVKALSTIMQSYVTSVKI